MWYKTSLGIYKKFTLQSKKLEEDLSTCESEKRDLLVEVRVTREEMKTLMAQLKATQGEL